jgi:hypothetical protein
MVTVPVTRRQSLRRQSASWKVLGDLLRSLTIPFGHFEPQYFRARGHGAHELKSEFEHKLGISRREGEALEPLDEFPADEPGLARRSTWRFVSLASSP